MKKKILMLLSAVMLGSAGAFAQIAEAELQKTDVNGDGNVDVADMVGVMDVMKNLGHPDGEYKYYLGVATEEQLNNQETFQEYVNSLIQNSTTTYKGKPSVINIPVAPSKNQWMVWIFDSRMGQPTLYDNSGFQYVYGTAEELGISNPEGYTVWFREAVTHEAKAYVRWSTPFSKSSWEAGFEYSEGDVDNNGVVNEEDLNIVKENMKAASSLEGVKYGWFFLTGEDEAKLLDNNKLSEWVEEQMDHLNGVYTCRPSKLHVKEKGYYFWIYPTSFGNVEKLTDTRGTSFYYDTASDLSITPPQGYNVLVIYNRPSTKHIIIWK